MLGSPRAAVVFEDALAGVEAGRAGHFGCVVASTGSDHAQALHDTAPTSSSTTRGLL